MYRDLITKLQAANVSGDSELVKRWELQKILDDDIYKELCDSGIFDDETVSLTDVAFYLAAADEGEERLFFQQLSYEQRREILVLNDRIRALSPLKKVQNNSRHLKSSPGRSQTLLKGSQSFSTLNVSNSHGRHLQQKVELLERQTTELKEEAASVRARRQATELRTQQLQNDLNIAKNSFQGQNFKFNGLNLTDDLVGLLNGLQKQQELCAQNLRTEVCKTLPQLLDSQLSKLLSRMESFRQELTEAKRAAQELKVDGVGSQQLGASSIIQKLGQSQAAMTAANALQDLQNKVVAASETAAQLSRLVQKQLQGLYSEFGQARATLDEKLDDILMALAKEKATEQTKKQNKLVLYVLFGAVALQVLITLRVLVRLRA